MRGFQDQHRLPREGFTQTIALFCLLIMAATVLVGPSGLLAWSENNRLLAERQKELKVLAAQRDELRNRVKLLDPRGVDPDMAGELLRSNLNVVHPDEVLILIK
jgi:cell division protein FtsB